MNAKKMFRVVMVICALLLLGSLKKFVGGSVVGVKREIISDSKVFSDGEINNAISIVIEYFDWHFSGCTLTRIWFDSSYSDFSGGYYGGKEITIFSDFDVDSTGGDGSFEPNSTYTSWSWTLVWNPITWSWLLVSFGYG